MKNKTVKFLMSLTAAAVLTACGGGGGGETSLVPTPATSVVLPSASISTIVSAVSVPAFPAASEELAAFNLLNAERSRCGFGKVAEKTSLSAAALSHANWSLINNFYGHFESASVPTGYSGVTPKDRTLFAGYNAAEATETLVGSVGQPLVAGYGEISARELMSLPYHLFGMMSPYKDVGISVRSINSVTPLVANGLSKIAVYDFGVATGEDFQKVDGSTVLTYPCDGVTNINYRVTGEFPNPVPGRNLELNPLGHPILIMVRKGQNLAITSSSLTEIATGLPVALRPPVTASNDPNGIFGPYGNYMGYVAPDVPLAKNTRYQATVNGTNNDVAFSRTFTFTTGIGG